MDALTRIVFGFLSHAYAEDIAIITMCGTSIFHESSPDRASPIVSIQTQSPNLASTCLGDILRGRLIVLWLLRNRLDLVR